MSATVSIHCNVCKTNFANLTGCTRISRGLILPETEVTNVTIGVEEVTCYYCTESVGIVYGIQQVLLLRAKYEVRITVTLLPTLFENSCHGAASS